MAAPAFQEYSNGAIGPDELRDRVEGDGNLLPARYRR